MVYVFAALRRTSPLFVFEIGVYRMRVYVERVCTFLKQKA